MGKDIDDTRERIGVGELDDEQRKKLFKDFVDHGGKVVDKRKVATDVSRRRPATLGAGEKRPPVEPGRVEKTGRPLLTPGVTRPTSKKRKKRLNLASTLRINIKGQLLKVWGFGGKRLREGFVAAVKKDIKGALVDVDLVTGSMLRGNSSVSREILRSSTGEDGFLYECIARLNDIYDDVEWSDFEKLISDRRIPKTSQIPPCKSLFKKMYILGQYRSLCKLHAYKAVEIQKKHKKIDQETVERLRTGLKSEIDLVLDDFLKQLHIILCRIGGRYLPLYSQKLDDFLQLTGQDKMGYITKIEKKKRVEALKLAKEAMQKSSKTAVKPEKEEIKVPKHVERGLSIVEEALQSYEQEHAGVEHPLQILDSGDKMYSTLVLLDRFDSQYSFVLTTSKIIYNIDYVEQKKVDIKEDLNHAYLLFNEAREEAKEYTETVREMKRTQNDRRLTQYQQSVILEKLEKKLHNMSRKSRNTVAGVMKRIEEILSGVITDYKEKKILLQNPDDYLQFDPSIDGQKKLDGKRIIEAIVETFLFSATLAFLLKYGNLSGAGIYAKQEADLPREK